MTETQILMLNNLIYDPVFTSEGAEAFSEIGRAHV